MSDDTADIDAFLDGDDDDETPTAPQTESQQFSDLRKRLRGVTSDMKKYKAEAETNAGYKEQYLKMAVPKFFEEAGVEATPLNVKVFLAEAGAEPLSAEAVKSWATANEVAVKEPPAEETQTLGSESTFVPTVGGDPPGAQGVPVARIDEAIKAGDIALATRLMQGKVIYDNPEAAAQATGR